MRRKPNKLSIGNYAIGFARTIFAIYILLSAFSANSDDGFVRFPRPTSVVGAEQPGKLNRGTDSSNAKQNEKTYEDVLESRGYVFFPPREKNEMSHEKLRAEAIEVLPATKVQDREVKSELPDLGASTSKSPSNDIPITIYPGILKSPRGNDVSDVATNKEKLSPTIEFKFDESTRAQFTENHATFSHSDKLRGETTHIQVGRDSLGSTFFAGKAGKIINENFAVGTNVYFSDRRSDLNFSAAIFNDSKKIQIRSSLGLLQGTQGVNFYSGYSDVDLRQVSRLLEISYLPELSDSQIFELVGIKFWDSKAKQLSAFDGIYVEKETMSSFDTYLDPRRLSEGKLSGYSGTVRLKLAKDFSLEHSLGRERLYFPFSDGTFETSQKLYTNTILKWIMDGRSSAQIGLSTGAFERKERLDLSYDGITLSILNSEGLAGQKNFWSAGISYNLTHRRVPDSFGNQSSLGRNKTTRTMSVLESVSSRPVEFPQTFTVKTDPTSVRLVSTIAKGVITWQSAGSLGTFYDSASPSRHSISIQLQSTNSNGYPVSYATSVTSGSLPAGLSISSNGLISGSAAAVTADTTFTFQVAAKSNGAPDVVSAPLSITVKAPNTITWVSAGSLGDFNDAAAPSRTNIQIQLSATSSSGAQVTFGTSPVSGALPPGLNVSSSGLISGTANAVTSDTTYTFTLNAYALDASTSISQTLSITIRKPQSIVWTSFGSLGTFYDTASPSRSNISIQLQSSSTNGGTITYSTALASGSLPSGLSLSSSGLITGTASAVATDTTYTFTVVASSPNVPSSTSSNLSITIKAANVITWSSSELLGTYNESSAPSRSNISIQLAATSSTGSAITYDTNLASGSLPPGLTLSASGLISGTAAAVTSNTTYTFSVTASSADAQPTTSSTLSIVLKSPDAISWVSSGSLGSFNDAFAPSRSSVSIQLVATSASGDALTYDTSLISGSLPSGLSLSSSGLISGTASAVTSDTTYTFRVGASTINSGSVSSSELSITIKAPVLVKFTTSGVTILSGSPTVTSNSITFPSGLSSARVVLAGGGGGGGNGDGGGGGGAGALLINSNFVTGGQVTYAVSIGRGGYGGAAVGTCGAGEDGEPTSFGSVLALGGGGGGCSNPDYAGRSGGSGGGASQNFAGGSASASCGSVISGFSYFCNPGGSGNQGSTYRAGGGGGAGGAGNNGTNVTPGNGGEGYLLSSEFGGGYVAGGGGGGNGVAGYSIASGGSGVGGNSGSGSGTNGTADTGSGGGGGGVSVNDVGGNGAGGFVIIRY